MSHSPSTSLHFSIDRKFTAPLNAENDNTFAGNCSVAPRNVFSANVRSSGRDKSGSQSGFPALAQRGKRGASVRNRFKIANPARDRF